MGWCSCWTPGPSEYLWHGQWQLKFNLWSNTLPCVQLEHESMLLLHASISVKQQWFFIGWKLSIVKMKQIGCKRSFLSWIWNVSLKDTKPLYCEDDTTNMPFGDYGTFLAFFVVVVSHIQAYCYKNRHILEHVSFLKMTEWMRHAPQNKEKQE
jgi:hypothetical protein